VVTGGAGFLGKPTVSLLTELGADVFVPRSSECDLTDRNACVDALADSQVVLHLAATVGGIGFGRRNPALLIRDNLAMGLNVFQACYELGVDKLVAASSVCAYPKHAPVPFKEEDLWDGYPEETNAPYGLAKKMLIVLSDAYRSQFGLNSCVPVMANLYGPGDDFSLEDSHVVAAMIRKYAEAEANDEREVVLWGTGTPSREFLFVADAARALILAAEHADFSEPFNIGTGVETKIADLADLIAKAVGFRGETVWDTTRPDGQPVRYLDVSRARERIGFIPQTSLQDGLAETIASFREVSG
jgi:GDP-L-fucose synthase